MHPIQLTQLLSLVLRDERFILRSRTKRTKRLAEIIIRGVVASEAIHRADDPDARTTDDARTTVDADGRRSTPRVGE